MAELKLAVSDELEKELEELFKKSAREVFAELARQELHNKPYLNLNETAEYIGCSYGTVRKFINEFGLKVIRVGTFQLISKEEINRFLKKYEQ
ncbi:excisionase family DNA-binding protein [Alkalibacterium sp. MB6]|uniref:excisionase family DNA-binding protein n=1 Tax=Alkalibacterium sp. MB6 TaxID=2081965 RepID=UPI0013795D4F|nr:excisionase family DNA-binding protein [Alkalibacterium sp. MB6]